MCDVLAALVIGMIGAFCFIIFQVVLLVDFAHRWNEWWLVVTIAMYDLIRLLGYVLLVKSYMKILCSFSYNYL